MRQVHTDLAGIYWRPEVDSQSLPFVSHEKGEVISCKVNASDSGLRKGQVSPHGSIQAAAL